MSASFTLEWILTFCSEEEDSLFIAHSVQCSSMHLTHPSGALCNQHAETRGVNSSSKPVSALTLYACFDGGGKPCKHSNDL